MGTYLSSLWAIEGAEERGCKQAVLFGRQKLVKDTARDKGKRKQEKGVRRIGQKLARKITKAFKARLVEEKQLSGFR